MRIAPSIHAVGSASMVNVYLVEEAGSVTIIDAGMPGHYGAVRRELAALGRTMDDVRGVILTHGHSDHLGMAERLRHERGLRPWIHEADAALAKGEAPNPSRGMGRTRLGPLLGFLWFAFWRGGLKRPIVGEVATFGDGATLDLPGSPRVILVPGHTPGSAALHVAALDALFVGDALATYGVTTGLRGPQVAPFTADRDAALGSLARLEPTNARLVLPGHGAPFREGIGEAVRLVRSSAAASPA